MKNIFKIFLAAAVTGLSSCTSMLDMTPPDRVSDKTIWETTQSAEYSINYIYSYIYDVTMSQSVAGQTEAYTDQMKYGSYNYNSLCFIPSEIAYGEATTFSAGYVDAYMGSWSSWYGAIRRINQSLSELKKYGQMSDEDKVRLEAELRFMRAFMYFDLVKRYKESREVIHAIEAHHGDVEPKTITAVIVQAADAISAARPGARRENLENYIKRLEKLEELTTSFNGVESSYAIQAGREIRIMV